MIQTDVNSKGCKNQRSRHLAELPLPKRINLLAFVDDLDIVAWGYFMLGMW